MRRRQQSAGGAWCDPPVSLQEAIARTPVLIRLEEGYRGPQEELSLSAGDTMGLEGITERQGVRMVMAYYVSTEDEDEHADEERTRTGKTAGETEKEKQQQREAAADAAVCRALLLLPHDSLPSLQVRVWEGEGEEDDEDDSAYQNFLGCHFSHCSWLLHRDDLLKKMGDSNYINVNSILLVAADPSGSTPLRPHRDEKEQWRPARRSPPPPPGSAVGGGKVSSPPPRPPRVPLPPPSGTHGPAATTSPTSRQPPTPPQPQPPTSPVSPPPRPPRKSSVKDDAVPPPRMPPVPVRQPEREGGGVQGKAEEEEGRDDDGDDVFAMPSLAEMFVAGGLRLEPGDQMKDSSALEPVPEVPQTKVLLPERKDKKKISPLKKVAETLGKRINVGVGRMTPKGSSSSHSSTTPTTPTTPSPLGDVTADDSSDDEGIYTRIDESQMDPSFDRLPCSKETKGSTGKTAQGQQTTGKDEKSKAGEKRTKAAVVKPTVRVSPQGVRGPLMMSQPTSQLTSQPQAKERPAHPMMTVPKHGSVPDSDILQADKKVELVTSPLQNMTCAELCVRLRQCGMPTLAQQCQEKCIDGDFFLSLNDDTLRKPPFSLATFEVDTKLTMVKAGWVPK